MIVLEAPEPDSHVAIVDAPGASADAAVTAAWALYQPGFKRSLKLASSRPARKGWDERRIYEYETSPSERVVVLAVAMRRGEAWTVLLVDASEPTFDKRGAAVELVFGSLRPKGYVRESFAGRKAHPLDAGRIKQITDFVEASQKKLGIPGVAVALVDGGKVVFEGGFGVRELGKPAKVDKDTLFAVASNTKGLTTLLLAKLVDEKKLAWDTPVTRAYPGFKLGDADLTAKLEVQHLVCACTGLPVQDVEWIFRGGKMTAKEGMDLLATMRPTTRFGEVFQYSNALAAAGGWVAAHVLYPDKELGAAYDEAMKKLVFDPLGMRSATFDMARMEKGDHAGPHVWDVDGKTVRAGMDPPRAMTPFRPAGGAWISVHDMTKYALLELSKGLLPNGERYVSEAALLARRAPQMATGEDVTYGMGLSVSTSLGVPFVHHGGSLFGYDSDWVIFPDQGVGAVLLTNSNVGDLMLGPFTRKVAEVIFDGKPEAAENLDSSARTLADAVQKQRATFVIPPDPALASKLAPRYTSPDLGALEVKKQGASTRFALGPYSMPVASWKTDDGTVSFVSIEPGLVGVTFVAGERGGKRVLIVRGPQHEYVLTESGASF